MLGVLALLVLLLLLFLRFLVLSLLVVLPFLRHKRCSWKRTLQGIFAVVPLRMLRTLGCCKDLVNKKV